MAVAFVQQSTAVSSAGVSSVTRTLTGVSSGNIIVGSGGRIGATNRTLSWSDDRGNTWTTPAGTDEQLSPGGSAEVELAYANNTASGDTVVTLTASGTTELDLVVFEFSGQDTTTQPDVVAANANASSTTHYCAPSGEIDSSADSAAVYAFAAQGSTGAQSGPTGWTSTVNGQCRHGYIVGQVTDNRAEITTGTARASVGAILAIKAAGGAAANPKGVFGLPLDGPFRRAVY